MPNKENLLKYGIDSSLSSKIINKGLSLTSLRSLNKKNLIKDYQFKDFEVEQIKNALIRKPIEENTLFELLENSAYTCNICKGLKSDAYVIHHIKHYNICQDNSYQNLIVLCPNDHELAHREGEALANKISENQLINAKLNWEKKVRERNVSKAAIEGNIYDLDYVNVERILELCIQTFDGIIPDTRFTERLEKEKLILSTGGINPKLYQKYSLNPNTPLKFFAGFGSKTLTYHYFELLIKCLSKYELYDLDELMNLKSLKEGLIGKFCFYVGGIYGRQYRGEISKNSDPTFLHFKRNKIRVKWFIDPMYLTSTTASWRISSRHIFINYGKILNVQRIEEEGKRLLEITIRPYAYGIPNHIKDRTPIIKYIKEGEKYDEYFEKEE